jgi:hypothetical protein
VSPSYQCVAFRAANWAVSPSRNVVCALQRNGIRIETSVFKHGRRAGIVSFEYSHAHSDLVPWRAAEEDICCRDDAGKLLEIPIYCERRWLGAFVTPNRIYRAVQTRNHRIATSPSGNNGNGAPSANGQRKLFGKLSMLTNRHAWKADFNQCSGRELIRALERAEAKHGHRPEVLPFVLIGHSKLFTRFNERTLAPFLTMVRSRPTRFGFANLSEFDPAKTEAEELQVAATA